MADHIHHWVIETPDGKASAGVCKGCGEQRFFPNFIESYGDSYGVWADRPQGFNLRLRSRRGINP